MTEVFNIYCDESCHLENDQHKVMVLGALWCPATHARESAVTLRKLKANYGLAPTFEMKWSKVSPSQVLYYVDVLDYFLANNNMHFRALIVPDKSVLNHEAFQQDHDTWYYKMYYQLLKPLLKPENKYRIYLDIKDTRSSQKCRKLHEVLCNSIYDFTCSVVDRVQPVRSDQVEQIQLADLLTGMVSYFNREVGGSQAKLLLVERLQQGSRRSLRFTTSLGEEKVNIFRWQAQGGVGS